MNRVRLIGCLLAAALGASGCGELPLTSPAPPPLPPNPVLAPPAVPIKADAQITNALTNLVDSENSFKLGLPTASAETGTPLGDLFSLGSPIGYSLRTRYMNIGIPLAEALTRDTDPVFHDKLITLARWDSNDETRAAALVAVARFQNAADLPIFKEALLHLHVSVRFGALEALQVWGHPEQATPLLVDEIAHDYEPILRVYAAGALARMGDSAALHRLRDNLDDPSWLVKAMSARFLGEVGTAEDYDILVSRIGREQTNDFVVAEYCIAALKLFPKKNPL